VLGDEFPLCKHSSFRFFSCDGINYVANLLFLSIVESANNKYIYIYILWRRKRKLRRKRKKSISKESVVADVSGSSPSFPLSSPLNKRPLLTCSLGLFTVSTPLLHTQSQGPFLPHKPTLPP
jgi:hypothetical protein